MSAMIFCRCLFSDGVLSSKSEESRVTVVFLFHTQPQCCPPAPLLSSALFLSRESRSFVLNQENCVAAHQESSFFPTCKSKHAVSFEKRCGWYYLSPQACGNILQGNFARLELIKLLFFPSLRFLKGLKRNSMKM